MFNSLEVTINRLNYIVANSRWVVNFVQPLIGIFILNMKVMSHYPVS